MSISASSRFLNFINLRNAENVTVVVVQMSMLFSALVIILGIVYVVILVGAILIHHLLYDKDVKQIPDYVKNSVQFEEEERRHHGSIAFNAPNVVVVGDPRKGKRVSAEETSSSGIAGNIRKLANLDKFLADRP